MVKKILVALWLAPVALPIWLLYLLPAWACGLIRLDRAEGGAAIFGVQREPTWWWNLWSGWGGHAMPFAVVATSPRHRALIHHELRHTRQWLALGPLFPVVYLLLLVAFGYSNHPLEVDAEAHEAV